MTNEKFYSVHIDINDTDKGCMTCGEKQEMHYHRYLIKGAVSLFWTSSKIKVITPHPQGVKR